MTIKEGFGFIRCVEREARMFFHFSEMMEADREPRMQEEVEFTVIQVSVIPKVRSLSCSKACSRIEETSELLLNVCTVAEG